MKAAAGRYPLLLDAIAIAACGVGLVAILVVAFADFRSSTQTTAEPSIGVLKRRLEDVRRRAGQSLVWNDIGIGETVRRGDAIYVGAESAAQVVLADGARIDIDENSLVVVELTSNRAEKTPAAAIAVLRGGAAPIAGQGQLAVRVGDSDVALNRGARAKVRLSQKNGARVEVTHGQAALTTKDGERLALREGQRGTADGEVRELELELLAPAANEKVFSQNDRAQVNFQWRPLTGRAPYIFELSNDADFRHLIARVKTKRTSHSQKQLHAGVYYWRVRRFSAGREQLSAEQKLTVRRDQAPVPYEPAADADVDGNNGQTIRLAWSALDGVTEYDLEVVAKKDPQQPLFQTTTSRPFYRLTLSLPEGRYCYRVRGRDPGLRRWSALRCFRVVLRPVLMAPEVIEHRRETIADDPPNRPQGTFLFYLLGGVAHAAPVESAIVLRWKEISGAVAYKVEIAEDLDFRQTVVSERVAATFFRWPTVTRRVYYWRVRGIDANGREGAASLPIRIEAEVSAPELIEPRDQKAFAYTSGPPKVVLRWRPSEVLKTYIVEISKKARFPAAETETVSHTDTQHILRGKSLTTYYWRVTGVDLTGQRTEASAARSFRVYAAAPVAVAPPREQALVREQNDFLVPVKWSWRPVKSFEVQASMQPQFKSPRVSVTSKKPQAQITPPGFGVVYWRVRGVSPRTAWSEAATFVVLPAVPTPLAPEDDAALTLTGLYTEVQLRYQTVPAVTTYEVELQKEWIDREEPIRTQKFAGPVAVFRGLTVGRYTWAVRAAPGGLETNFSEPRSFDLVAREPLATRETEQPAKSPTSERTKRWIADPVFSLGPRIGFLVNLGAIVAPRFGASFSYRLPMLNGALAVTLSADYYLATTSLLDAGSPLRFDSELHSVPLELVGSYRLRTPWLDISLGAGAALVISYISLSSESYPPLGQVSVDGGGVVMAEAAVVLGPGRAFVALSFAITSWNSGSVGENNPGGFTAAAGYRFGVL